MYDVPESKGYREGFFYKFPKIRTLNDVLPLIVCRDEFVHIQKDGYSIVDYVVAKADTFEPVTTGNYLSPAIRNECRGLVFDADNRLVSRPFHKFFNVGEKEWTQPNFLETHELAYVANKEDGSMVRPVLLSEDAGWNFMTRKGHTDVAKEAEDVFNAFSMDRQIEYDQFFQKCWLEGKTPILEYVGPQNRIVLEYNEADLVLLAVRDTYTGVYDTPQEINERLADFEQITAVGWRMNNNKSDFLTENLDIKHLTDLEGRVMTFHNKYGCQTKVKLKTEWYVNLHRAKSELAQPRNLVRMFVDGSIDDLYPELDAETLKKVREVAAYFWYRFETTVSDLVSMFREFEKRGMSRKEVALSAFFDDNVLYRSLFFKCFENRDKKNIRKNVLGYVLQNSQTNKSFEKVIGLLELNREQVSVL